MSSDSGPFGTGDSFLLQNILPPDLAQSAFQLLSTEVAWQSMSHRGGEVPRLVAVQGSVNEDGRSIPVYRHPSDSSPPLLPFSPTVLRVKYCLEDSLRQANRLDLELNHVLIQKYRSGDDYISEHSDKTIDIVRGTSIINLSLGAQRAMTLRTKKPANIQLGSELQRTTQTIPLSHNSAFVLGPESNRAWLHGIRANKRPAFQKSVEELACGGERISLTFRCIGTFLLTENEEKEEEEKRAEERTSSWIWGQGAEGKTKASRHRVVNGGEDAEALLRAFGLENQRVDFDWDASYGKGSNVLHFSPPP